MIANEDEYNRTLARISELMGAAPGTAEMKELERLVILVEQYEKVHYPIGPPTPEAAAKFRAEQEAKEHA